MTAGTTTRADGTFYDESNHHPGACGPLLIHTDKSKTKEKENEERSRQRNGEAPAEATVAARFEEGITDVPEMEVHTTFSGSMTQEIFFEYAKHFVNSLSENHGPVILFFDGHASHWNVQAL